MNKGRHLPPEVSGMKAQAFIYIICLSISVFGFLYVYLSAYPSIERIILACMLGTLGMMALFLYRFNIEEQGSGRASFIITLLGDIGITRFLTIRLAKYLNFLVIASFWGALFFFIIKGGSATFFALLALGGVLSVLAIRISLETMISLQRIADNTSIIARREHQE